LPELGDVSRERLGNLDRASQREVIAASGLLLGGQVVPCDGLCILGSGGHGLGFGEGLQPGEDGGVVLAGFEAAVELVADGAGKEGEVHGKAKG